MYRIGLVIFSVILYYITIFIKLTRLQYFGFSFSVILAFVALRKHLKYKATRKLKGIFRFLLIIMLFSLSFRVLFPDFDEAYYENFPIKNPDVTYIALLILISITEELVFRGFLQTSFANYHEVAAIVASSVFFSAPHYKLFSAYNLPHLTASTAFVFLVSLIMSYSLYSTRNYLVPVVLHIGYNILTSLQLILRMTAPTAEIWFWTITLFSLFYFARGRATESH